MTPLEYVLAYIKRGYFSVDEEGQIWRLRIHRKGQHFSKTWLPLKEPRRAEQPSGSYLAVSITLRDRPRVVMAHHVVYSILIGPLPPNLDELGLIVNHIDGNKHNNHPSNLELITKAWNSKHARDSLGTGPWQKTNIKQLYDQILAQQETARILASQTCQDAPTVNIAVPESIVLPSSLGSADAAIIISESIIESERTQETNDKSC